MGPGAEGEEVVCLQLVGCRRPEALVPLLGLMSVSAQKPAPPNMQCLAKLDKTVLCTHRSLDCGRSVGVKAEMW